MPMEGRAGCLGEGVEGMVRASERQSKIVGSEMGLSAIFFFFFFLPSLACAFSGGHETSRRNLSSLLVQ